MITREQFMEFFRSDDFNEKMTADDCVEIFTTCLKGSSDVTPKLFNSVLSEYGGSEFYPEMMVIPSPQHLRPERLHDGNVARGIEVIPTATDVIVIIDLKYLEYEYKVFSKGYATQEINKIMKTDTFIESCADGIEKLQAIVDISFQRILHRSETIIEK